MHQGNQHSGELDLVVISPLGHILLIEVKAGAIEEFRSDLAKLAYASVEVTNFEQLSRDSAECKGAVTEFADKYVFDSMKRRYAYT